MSFKIQKKTHRWFPVEVDVPTDEGRKRKQTFDAQFEVVQQSEIDKLIRSLEGKTPTEAVEPYFVSFRRVEDEDGAVLEPNAENRHALLEVPGVARALWNAFLRSNGIEAKS